MVDSLSEIKKLQYQYEVLKAKVDIREFFLKTSVKEVYENIGQVLSIVRMQLAFFEGPVMENKIVDISQSGDLLGQSIKDLRYMCRSFYPDVDILNGNGFVVGLENTVRFLYPDSEVLISASVDFSTCENGFRLILFNIIQDILVNIKQLEGKFKNMSVSAPAKMITCKIRYAGERIRLNKNEPVAGEGEGLTLEERIHLLDGKLKSKVSRPGIYMIILSAPLNYKSNE